MVAVTADAEVSLAASVLAAYGTVRRQLGEQQPRLGRVEQQARDAFGQLAGRWVRMAAGDMAGECDEDRAVPIAEAMGTVVSTEAAKGLAVGMDVQLAKGWAPEVAWQRALAGYGLNEKAMRGYLAGVMGIKTEVAKAVVPQRAAAAVQRALDSHARRLAADGMVVVAKFGRSPIKVAGIAVRALDTGRVLMLQRALDPKDPAGGLWEFPGGHLEPGETPVDGGKREWQEEVGRRLPSLANVRSSWTNGIYQGFVVDVEHEADLPIHRGRGAYVNPDDPDGDAVEQVAWWSVDQFARNPAIRPELRAALPDVRRALGEVDKAFDPDQARDRSGKWTAGAAAGRKRAPAAAATVERPAPVDLPPVVEEEANPYLAARAQPANPYLTARARSVNPYQQSASPYQQSVSPYQQSANPYQAQAANPYLAAQAQQPSPYLTPIANPYLQPAPGKKKINRTLLVLVPDRAATADDRDLVVNQAHGGGFFFPQQDLESYFRDDILQGGGGGAHGMHSVIDFARIHRFLQDDPLQDDRRIGAQYNSSIWSVAASPKTFKDLDDADWADLLEDAHPLWEEAQADPVSVADNLSSADLMDVAALAGYPLASAAAIKDEIARQVEGVEMDRADVDYGLLDALADYAVWRQPEILGEDGVEFGASLNDHDLTDAFDTPSTPTVMFFRSFDGPDDDDRSDINGRYMGEAVVYRSAMRETATTNPGVIGVRELVLERDKLGRV